jgi:hypothetical protein
MLPVELLRVIAGVDIQTYRSMLALPPFVRSLDPGTITDFMINFGFGIKITHTYIKWTRDGVAHRNDGPAMIYSDGIQCWYRRGEFHRVGGPAIVCADGMQFWYQHGNFHRDDGPAAIYPDGERRWYQHGKLHRDDGPALIYSGGSQRWYRNGKFLYAVYL